VVVAWGLALRLLAVHGVRLLPLSLARELTLQGFLALVSIAATLFGLALSWLLLDRPRDALGLRIPGARTLLGAALLAPPIFVLASFVAVQLALPTLLEELRAKSVQAVRESTGEFGRELVHSPALMALFWGALLAPIAEELYFRGALYSLVQNSIERLRPRRSVDAGAATPSARLPEGVVRPSAFLQGARALGHWFASGGVAVLVSAAVFGLFHADMQGGMGIIRVASAVGLGLACGAARQATSSLTAPLLIHVLFNALSIATSRRWVVTESFPTYRMVPTLLMLVGGVCFVLWLGLVLLGRGSRQRSAPADS
jgi:membrane protease YdiL (CAAX protease family)